MITDLESLRKIMIFPPGDTIDEELPCHIKTRADLAQHLGKPLDFVNQLIDGQIAVDETLAQQLETFFGLSATYSQNKEKQFRGSLAAYEASL